MSALYSFVLPAYKSDFFKEAIDSILAQTYSNFELIIVNDASPYDLDSIVYSYNDARIRYYKNKINIGGTDLVAQWNHCLQYAEGEFIILASDDDMYFPSYLEKMNALVKKYPNVNVFRPRIQKIDAFGKIIGIEGYLKEYATQLEFIHQLTTNRIYSGIPYYIFKNNALKEMEGFINFPLAWFSDDATVINLSKNGIVSSADVLFSFRISGQSISTKINTYDYLIKKINATKEFYKYFKILLENTSAINEADKYMKTRALSILDSNCANHIQGLVANMSLKILFRYFWKIKEVGNFKKHELSNILATKIIRTK